MEALDELCDMVEQNPKQFLDTLPWICRQCTQRNAESPRVSRSHLNAVLAVTRILARNLDTTQNHAKFVVLEFLQALRASFHSSFWPHSFTLESISVFYCRFLGYVSCLSMEFGSMVVELTEEAMTSFGESDRDQAISRAFLVALSHNFPSIHHSDGDKLITTVLSQFDVVNSVDNELSFGYSVGAFTQELTSVEDQSIESLEKQEIAFKLVTNILSKVKVDSKQHLQVRSIAKRQLQSMSAFIKSKRRDWNDQDPALKTRITAKLFVYQAAANMEIESLVSLETDGKKRLILEALTLLFDAADACLTSVWRKMKACEDLFSSLLSGIEKIAVAKGGKPFRLLLIRLKPLVLSVCAQPDTKVSSQENMFESIFKFCCEIIESGWAKVQASVGTFILGLASSIRDNEEQVDRNKEVPAVQMKVIQLLADISVALKKPEVADMIFPYLIESLDKCDASTPHFLRHQLLDAVSRIATLGFEKSYHETVVLMTRSYLSKISKVESEESKTSAPKSSSELSETLPAGFLTIARGLMKTKLRADYRHRLLSLCSDVGLASEPKSRGSGADLLGPLLPAVAEICSDFDPTSNMEPSLLKLFRNLWFYIALFGLAPPTLKTPLPEVKTTSNSVNKAGRISTFALQAVVGPYMWNTQWALAVRRISQGTPPLVVSSVKWLENELELNALHNSDSLRGSGNKKVASTQRTALSIALGGRVDVSAMKTISEVKATYLLAVALLEVIRFISNGGILNGGSSVSASRSAFSCVFEYLKSPNLTPAVSQCLTAIVHRAFEAAVSWLEDRISLSGNDASIRESTTDAHACFLIKSMSQKDEHIRDISVNLLIQIRNKFPQVLWSSSCLDCLLFPVHDNAPSMVVNNPAWIAAVRSLYQKIVQEWIIISLSYAPCTTQGLLQDKQCKANTLPRTETTTDMVSLLSEIKIGTGKNKIWSGMRKANIPSVMAAAAAASGANLKVSGAFKLEVLGTGVVTTTVKCNYTRQIADMLRLENTIGGFLMSDALISNSVRLLQQFVKTADKGEKADMSQFRETCCQATALLLSTLQAGEPKTTIRGFSQLLRLLCWCPAYMLTPDAMETGVFIWTWLVSAAPLMGSLVLSELVDAWIWTIDAKRGLFASDVRYYGPAAKLRPQLFPGEPESPPESDPVDQILAHRLWLGFLIDRFEVVRHNSGEQLLLLSRLLQRSTNLDWGFTRHPAAAGTFFSLMFLGLRFSSCQRQGNMQKFRHELQLLEDRIYRTSLGWFARQPEWYDVNIPDFCQSEALSVSLFAHFLSNEQSDFSQFDSKGIARDLIDVINKYHPVWGEMNNYAKGKDKRKELLLILCQHEYDRLDVWAQPISRKDSPYSRLKISSKDWKEYAKIAFSVDPGIAISLASRFPANIALKSEVIQLVQAHILDLRTIPEALPYFVTPKTVEENSVLLHQLPHWAACSITQALEFLTPTYKGHPRVMAYVLGVLEFYPPERVTFFMPQLVQSLRYDEGRLIEGYLLRAAQRSDIFAHILIWHLQGESVQEAKDVASDKNAAFRAILPEVRQHILDGFTPSALDLFSREFDLFDKVTSISGVLFSLPKEERRAGIRRELEKIKMQGEELYLPTAPNKLVRGIQVDSGIPLQSAAKVPIMITFNVVDRDGDHDDVKSQACIFKVGDDCRQDVLALQVISLLRDIFQAVGLNLYLFPYGVLPTGAERGIIEVVPNTRSRSQMGETTDGGLYEFFQQNYGPVGSTTFELARENFLISSAGYAVASLLLQPKDRHNGNLLFDDVGRLVHIDFGFILGTSPGGNMRFESAHFKLSHEMTQLLDPSGVMKSETWHHFVSLCVKGYLAARRYMDGIISTVQMMQDSGLPCFSRGDPVGNLRKRFHPEMSEREAAHFMIHVCTDAYNKWTTAGYDLIQYLQQGIEK